MTQRKFSSRTVLLLGFASVIAILLFSTVEVYRIQGIVSDQHMGIYREYVKQDEAISLLHRNIWLAGNYVRDFFLSSNSDRSVVLRSQIQDLKSESSHALIELDQANSNDAATQLVEANLKEYWAKLEPVPNSMATADSSTGYKFVQEEIVHRRTELYDALQKIKDESQAELQGSEMRFADKRLDSSRRLMFMLGLCVVVGFLVMIFSLRHAGRLEREAVRQYDETAHAKREMEQLSARLLEIEEDSRRRLSRELHDEIGQTLAVLQIEVSHAQALTNEGQPNLKERLGRARELAEHIVQSVRHISLRLRPALLDDLGLEPALQWLIEDFQRRSGVSSEFSADGVQDLLPDSVKTCVYRVVQEALHNCEKHAEASQVRVAIRQSINLVRVDVEDNGRGLELNSKQMPRRNAGLGILGMRERAARVGGTLTLESSPGYGTQICLQIPLVPFTSDGKGAAGGTEINANAYSNPVSG